MTERIAIIGDGLIGRSIKLASLRHEPSAEVRSFDRGDDLAGVSEATIVVLAAPVDAILQLLPSLPAIAPAARLITDTGSTKAHIVRAASAAGLTTFVAGHPMAGGTRSGPTDARATLFDGRPWFLIESGTTSAAFASATRFVQRLGAVTVSLNDGGEHDRLVAAISHLPQVVATALLVRVGETVGTAGLAHSGAGLRDTTRLAASDASVWAPILATNASAVAPLLKELARDLEAAADGLDDPIALARLFERARRFSFDP